MDKSTLDTLLDDALARVADIHDCVIYPLHAIVACENGEIVLEHSRRRPWEHPHDEIAMLKLAHKIHGCVPEDRADYFRDQLEAAQDVPHWGVASSSGLFIACSSASPWFAEAAVTFYASLLTHRA